MFELKKLHAEAIPSAVEKANRYRLLNVPQLAESVCLDILEVDPNNQDVLIMLILSLADQFSEKSFHLSQTRMVDLVDRLSDPYEKVYYSGLVCEKRGMATLDHQAPGYVVYEWLGKAMYWYDKADKLSPEENDDAILRWNTCARVINFNDQIRARDQDEDFHGLE
jgi:hypothetical protein